jgi:hypothetical protein
LRLEQIGLQLRNSNESDPALREGLRPFAKVMEDVHYRVSQRPIPTSPGGCSAETITKKIAESCNSVRASSVIADSITAYETSRRTEIVALRVSEVYLFSNDDDSWTVVEWIEQDSLKCIAIFHFDHLAESEDGSWLMHSGYNELVHADSTRLWKESRVDYNVAEIAHLKTLFGIAQHVLGVLQWAIADAVILYCEQDLSKVSNDEYDDPVLSILCR